MGANKSKNKTTQVQSSSSTNQAVSDSGPISPEQAAAYWGNLNSLTGGNLNAFATSGTAPVAYQGLSTDQLRALGGAGETRRLASRQAYTDRASQLASDPSMTLAQRQYSGGLNTRELASQLDAINADAEAGIVTAAQTDAGRTYDANRANADQKLKDQQALAEMYARFIGQQSSSNSYGSSGSSGSSKGKSSSFGFNLW